MANTCAVTGNVKNLLNSNVQNCAVKATVLTPFFHGAVWISGEIASTITDSSGNFSLTVVETETVGKKISFTFEYNDGTGATKRKAYTVIVPDSATVTLADLVTADESPITANTFPASSVTVVPTGGLTSDDVQDALTELQSDIDAITTLANGKIYVGNGSDAATEVTLSGDVTMSNAGVTDITAGVIVNADINSAAAIAHTKLANITAGSVLMGNGSNAPTATAITGDVTVTSSGVTAIASGVIVNADVNASAAIDHSKLAAITAASVLLGNGSNVPTATAITGDVTVNSSGVTAIGAGVIVNADVNASAAIDRSKIASGTNYRILANSSAGVLSENAALTAKHVIIADANGQLSGIAPGTANNVLKSDGTDWTSASISIPNQAVTSKTANYTATSTDDVILCSASGGAFSITLPAAASNTGKVLFIKKTDSSSNIVTVDGDASETIDGTTTKKLCTQNESLKIVCDGSNWQIVERRIPSEWVAYTPSFGGFGTAASVSFVSRRVGDSLEVLGRFTTGTVAPSAASISIGHNGTDSNVTIDTAKAVAGAVVGQGGTNAAASATYFGNLTALSQTGSAINLGCRSSTQVEVTAANGNALVGNTTFIAIKFTVPITDWEG